jgi:ribosomal protein S27AE
VNASVEETTVNEPVCERNCPKGGSCSATWKNSRWECSKCEEAMGPAVAVYPPHANSRTFHEVLMLRLSALELQRLLASIGVPNQVFRNRENLEAHVIHTIATYIEGLQPTPEQMTWAKNMIMEHMPEHRRHFQ